MAPLAGRRSVPSRNRGPQGSSGPPPLPRWGAHTWGRGRWPRRCQTTRAIPPPPPSAATPPAARLAAQAPRHVPRDLRWFPRLLPGIEGNFPARSQRAGEAPRLVPRDLGRLPRSFPGTRGGPRERPPRSGEPPGGPSPRPLGKPLEASYPGYFVRFIGGAIFVSGMLLMAYNVYMTVRQKDAVAQDNAATQPA